MRYFNTIHDRFLRALSVLIFILLGMFGFADTSSSETTRTGILSAPGIIKTVTITPNIIALRTDALNVNVQDIPQLTFKFSPHTGNQTLVANFIWYSLGYSGFPNPQPIECPIKPETSQITIDIPSLSHFGLYQVLVHVFSSNDLTINQYGQVMIAVIPDNECADYLPSSPFGVRTDFKKFDNDQIRQLTKSAGMAGVRWANETYDPMTTDHAKEGYVLSELLLNKVNVFGTFDITPILNEKSQTLDTKDLTEFCTGVRRLIDAFSSPKNAGITHWELAKGDMIMNRLPENLFAQIYEATADTIRAANPKATLILPESGNKWTSEVIRRLRNIGNDIRKTSFTLSISGHSYDQSPETLYDWENLIRAKDDYTSDSASDFWLTDIGWLANHTSSWQERQADFLVQSYVRAIAIGYSKVFWQSFVCDPSANPARMTYGLLDATDFSPRTSFVSYAAMVHLLEGSHYSEQNILNNDINIFTFINDKTGEETVIIWSNNTAGTITNATPDDLPEDWIMYDQFSNATILPKGTKALLTLSRTPIYLRSKNRTITQALNNWELLGFPKASIDVNAPPNLDNGVNIPYVLTNYSKKKIAGSYTIKEGDDTLITSGTLSLDPLTSQSFSFDLKNFTHNTNNYYPFMMTITPDNSDTSIELPFQLSEHIVRFGSAEPDCDFSEWQDIPSNYVTLEQNMTEIKPCKDWTLSATIQMMYDDSNLYCVTRIDERAQLGFIRNMQQRNDIELKMTVTPLDANGNEASVTTFYFPIHETTTTLTEQYGFPPLPPGVILAHKTVTEEKNNLLISMSEMKIPVKLINEFKTVPGSKFRFTLSVIEPGDILTESSGNSDTDFQSMARRNEKSVIFELCKKQ